MNRKKLIPLIVLLLLTVAAPLAVAQDESPPVITIISPQQWQTISEIRPVIKVEYYDISGIETQSVTLIVDRIDVTDWEETTVTANAVTYTPTLFTLEDGNHTIQVRVADTEGNTATETWTFFVDTTITEGEAEEGLDVFTIVLIILIITALIFLGLGIYILYLKKTKGFTFEKFFVQHPIQKSVYVLYIPFILAFLFIFLSLAYVSRDPTITTFSIEYVIVIGLFMGISPYAVDSLLEKRRREQYERAFSQFLFEIADAMRGGLDPTKAVIELAKTDTSILKPQIKIAADNIKLGRPFNEVMDAMSKQIDSDLVKRYTKLIGETSRLGGEPSQVVHRAAKDMDDFIKISSERRRQLTTQVTVIYIAFFVLLITLYQLITIFPDLATIDISLLTQTTFEEGGPTSTDYLRMGVITIKRRFLDLLIINSIGTGTVIGAFIEGHFKYGLVHSLILLAVSVIFFILLVI